MRLRSLVAMAVASLVVLLGAWPGAGIGDSRALRAATVQHGLGTVPLAAQGPMSATVGRGEGGYRVSRLRASNPAQRFGVAFSAGGVTLASGRGWVRLSLTGFGYASAVRPIAPVAPVVAANRVTYAHRGVGEWYENGPVGLEQGFTVGRAPRAGVGRLILSLSLAGNLRPRLVRGSVLLSGEGVQLRYGGLLVSDAHGRMLPSSLSVRSGRLWIEADDRAAAYPLRIDPFFQQSKLIGTDAVGASEQGYSVALSADGSTALIGASGDDGNTGAAWVFTRNPQTGVWSQQGAKLVGTGAAGAAEQGTSVALSGDGDTALLGGPADQHHLGAVWVFTRDPGSGVWTQQGSKLVGTGASGYVAQGWSVALSSDGSTALLGGYSDKGGVGAAWVFTREQSGAWSQQGTKLVGTGAAAPAQQGYSVALSADGNTALLGGPGDYVGVGAAWVFSRNQSGVWSQQGPKLVGTGASVYGVHEGYSVALSSDGDTAVVGGNSDNGGAGAAWVFTRDQGGVWSQQGPKLVGTGAVGAAQQGSSVALSADGNTALLGGPLDNGGAGAAWVFSRQNGVWSQQGSKLVGTGTTTGTVQWGWRVALSADGITALVGAPHDDSDTGATWVVTLSPPNVKLIASGAVGPAVQGTSVALSADGNTALVGAPGDNGNTGAAWVFTRNPQTGAWGKQGAKLVGTGASGAAEQGSSVALSADGSTALLGGYLDNGSKGAAWVFTRNQSGVWSQQGPKLVGTGASGPASQGHSVALSADGSTALLGGYLDNSAVGAAWVFTRNQSGVWSQQGPKLVGAGASGLAQQGYSVALASEGNTALVGGLGDNRGAGAAWVFTRDPGSGLWTQQGSKLVGTGAVGGAHQGYSVALSSDGNMALLGGPLDNGYQGAAWAFARSGSSWAQQGSKLVATGAVGGAQQGYSVALSADGTTALLGGPFDNENPVGVADGAAWVFIRQSGVWTQPFWSTLVGYGAVGHALQSASVALSADGETALVGGPHDNIQDSSYTGAAWVFALPMQAQKINNHFTVSHLKVNRGGTVGFTVKVPGAGTLDVLGRGCTRSRPRTTHSASRRSREHCEAFARRHLDLAHSGHWDETVRLGGRVARQVRNHRPVRVDLWVTYDPAGGTPRRIHFIKFVAGVKRRPSRHQK
ncbi:MAG: hypothetical protein JOY89_22475 [Solirubrobacterales bacterium]|nr:hypothetical protein [Solirubrobacterales bacterium]